MNSRHPASSPAESPESRATRRQRRREVWSAPWTCPVAGPHSPHDAGRGTRGLPCFASTLQTSASIPPPATPQRPKQVTGPSQSQGLGKYTPLLVGKTAESHVKGCGWLILMQGGERNQGTMIHLLLYPTAYKPRV